MPPKAGKEKKKGKIGKKGKKGKKGPKTDINSEVDNNDKSGENDDGNYDDDNEIYGENCDERLDFCLFGGLEYNISTESIISIDDNVKLHKKKAAQKIILGHPNQYR